MDFLFFHWLMKLLGLHWPIAFYVVMTFEWFSNIQPMHTRIKLLMAELKTFFIYHTDFQNSHKFWCSETNYCRQNQSWNRQSATHGPQVSNKLSKWAIDMDAEYCSLVSFSLPSIIQIMLLNDGTTYNAQCSEEMIKTNIYSNGQQSLAIHQPARSAL